MPRYPLAGGVGDMLKADYDPDDDTKIAFAQLETEEITGTAKEVLYDTPNTYNNGTTYAKIGTGWYASMDGDYDIICDVKAYDGTRIGYAAYRINGGSWVDMGSDDTGNYVTKTIADVALKEGDFIEYGVKTNHSGYGAYINDLSYKQKTATRII